MSAKEFYNSGEQGEYNGPQQIDNNVTIDQQEQHQGGYGGKLFFYQRSIPDQTYILTDILSLLCRISWIR